MDSVINQGQAYSNYINYRSERPIPRGRGLLEQVESRGRRMNHVVFEEAGRWNMEAYIQSMLQAAPATDNIMLYTGVAGMREFQAAMANAGQMVAESDMAVATAWMTAAECNEQYGTKFPEPEPLRYLQNIKIKK